MSRYYLSLGSNIDRYRHITAALEALAEKYGELQLSPVYESASVGFCGAPFLNSVVAIDSDLPLAVVAADLKQVEDDNDRQRGGEKFSARTLDIDILTCDQLVGEHAGIVLPREEILYNAYVLKPLADLAGEQLHPVRQMSYRQLWTQYDAAKQPLTAVVFHWRGRALPMPLV